VILPRGAKLGCVRSDSGSEYLNTAVVSWLCDHDVIREYTSDYTPKQNGVVESAIRDIKRLALTLMSGANLSSTYKSLWGEAMKYATLLLNNSPCAGNPKFALPCDLSGHGYIQRDQLYNWGSCSYVMIEDPLIMESRHHLCLYLGIPKNRPSDCKTFLKLDNGMIITSQNYNIAHKFLYQLERHFVVLYSIGDLQLINSLIHII
jgi:transposase InsO family protein